MLIFGCDQEIAAWVGKQLGVGNFGPCSAIGVARDSGIVGGAVFNNYHPPSIEISFATIDRRWATRATVRTILRYPFVQLGCRRVTAVTPAENAPTRAFLLRCGFREEGYHREALPTGDAVSYGLLRGECPWLEE